MNRLKDAIGTASQPSQDAPGSTNGEGSDSQPKSIFIIEAEAAEATLRLWLGLPLPSAERVRGLVNHHFAEHVQHAIELAEKRQKA